MYNILNYVYFVTFYLINGDISSSIVYMTSCDVVNGFYFDTDDVERKYFTCPSRESNPDRWIYRQTLYHVAVKTGVYSKAVEVYFIPSPVTFSPTKLNFVPKVLGHRESFLMRLRELLLGSCGLFTLGSIVVERKYYTFPSWESNPGRWIYRQTLYHVAVNASFFHKAVEVYFIP